MGRCKNNCRFRYGINAYLLSGNSHDHDTYSYVFDIKSWLLLFKLNLLQEGPDEILMGKIGEEIRTDTFLVPAPAQ